MKKYFLSVFTLILIVALLLVGVNDKPEQVVSLAESEDYSICVVGEGTVEAVPDKVTIYASIENVNNELDSARECTFEVFDASVKILTENGVDRDKIIVQSYTSYPNYDYSIGKQVSGYVANLTFSYQLDGLDKIQQTLTALGETGKVTTRNVNYEVSNEQELYSQALSQAFENAKDKASKLLGREDLSVKCVEEESTYYSNVLYRSYADGFEGSEMVGKVSVKARVKVCFE